MHKSLGLHIAPSLICVWALAASRALPEGGCKRGRATNESKRKWERGHISLCISLPLLCTCTHTRTHEQTHEQKHAHTHPHKYPHNTHTQLSHTPSHTHIHTQWTCAQMGYDDLGITYSNHDRHGCVSNHGGEILLIWLFFQILAKPPAVRVKSPFSETTCNHFCPDFRTVCSERLYPTPTFMLSKKSIKERNFSKLMSRFKIFPLHSGPHKQRFALRICLRCSHFCSWLQLWTDNFGPL